MRLINAEKLELELFPGLEKPEYAILSHTWEDGEEVTYQEFENDSRRVQRKRGYVKIVNLCEQALKDGFAYAWIDTCCIDKTSSTELSEAINSMFKWYADAGVCYAYLCDARIGEHVEWRLHSCRWFERGWTLQELLAPKEVYFFDKNWQPLFSRTSATIDIADQTGIPDQALRGSQNLKNFSCAQRFSWAAGRVTTRPEDIAYCLMGLFNVNMPLLYGEGTRAFIRLQEEIMKTLDDQSIFAWDPDTYDLQKFSGLLAPQPSYFIRSGSIVPEKRWESSNPYAMTNSGLSMSALMRETSVRGDFELYLRCHDAKQPGRIVALKVKALVEDGDQFARYNHVGSLQVLAETSNSLIKQRNLFFRQDIDTNLMYSIPVSGNKVSFSVQVNNSSSESNYCINRAYPENQWLAQEQILIPPLDQRYCHPGNRWSWHAALLIAGPNEEDDELCEFAPFIIMLGFNGWVNDSWWDVGVGPLSVNHVDLEHQWRDASFNQKATDTAQSSSNKTFFCTCSLSMKKQPLIDGYLRYNVTISITDAVDIIT